MITVADLRQAIADVADEIEVVVELEDAHGRPMSPVCGRSTDGLADPR